MKIKEVEQKVGINRKTIFFYEKEGLISPVREDNGYREYTEADIKQLEFIKFLRSMEISIDDIKGILSGEINFQEYIRENQKSVKEEIQQLDEAYQKMKLFEEKNLPLIPELAEIEPKENKSIFGYYKTTKKVQLGRRLTKAYALRQLAYIIFASVFMVSVTIYWLHVPMLIGIFILFPLYVLIGMGFCIKASSLGTEANNFNQSVEFNDSYIELFKNINFIESIRFFIATLRDDNDSFFQKYAYEEIERLEVLAILRYVKFNNPLPIHVWVADYCFHFNDGTYFYFYWPDILEGDGQFIATILSEKVKNIDDPNGILQVMKEGKSVHTYMTQKTIDANQG